MSPAGNHRKGAFKLAYFGKSSQPLFSGGINICAKQSFYRKTKTVTQQDGCAVETQQDIPYDGIKQAQDLIMEVTCLKWAHTLLEMVYVFIDEWMDLHPKGKFPSLSIPWMRFVDAGLAIEQLKKPGERLIPTTEGSFKKYLNNASAVPCHFIDEGDNERAEFLAFADMPATLCMCMENPKHTKTCG
ncbi:hypothetical protein K443DRAFT_8179 [Laccaria amethystina LaAM-08-1]|uniref:Uncharacterized protein n=1 Tax=Laccaria amethystina LaAM-08-1 TaxID=1095629 RepID=A0A0C9WPA9_9AGAR|nr:hypothetical protein K443DRAFT_8179 [Laccaria amethystina LaAM-08-1]